MHKCAPFTCVNLTPTNTHPQACLQMHADTQICAHMHRTAHGLGCRHMHACTHMASQCMHRQAPQPWNPALWGQREQPTHKLLPWPAASVVPMTPWPPLAPHPASQLQVMSGSECRLISHVLALKSNRHTQHPHKWAIAQRHTHPGPAPSVCSLTGPRNSAGH